MAFTASYEAPIRSYNSGSFIWRATNGGTVFASIPYNATAFDYFDDSSVVDDAIYFCEGSYGILAAGLRFNIGTAIVATSYTLVWEYYKRTDGWVPIEDLEDDTVSFSVTGQNDVKFPQQWQPNNVTIQGLTNGLWVRCRLSAVSGITEGGANQTDTIKYSRGTLTVSGTTDVSPGTFTNIYDWIVANLPYITVYKKHDSVFDFTRVGLIIASRVVTTNEVIELGCDCSSNNSVSYNNFNYVTSGVKLSETKGYGGSTFIIHGVSNSSVFNAGSQTKLYGSTIRTGNNNSDRFIYAGYCNLIGEWIDCNVELSTRMPGLSDIVSNVRITGSLVIASRAIGTYSNVSYLCTGGNFLYVYRTGFDLPDFKYLFKNSSATVFYVYQSSGDHASIEWNFINPGTPLNTITDSIKPLRFATKDLAAISKLWYYNDSAGTYTDYTTEAGDATVDDVPLGGDVGDMYYFGMLSLVSTQFGLGIYLVKDTVANDYVYKWEYYKSGAWHEITGTWDSSANLGQTGAFMTNRGTADSITVNGYSADYLRATIMTKGTGTPTATRVYQQRCSGAALWNLKEKYTIDLNIINDTGIGIEGAKITAIDENGVGIFSVNTDTSGDIVQQEILAKHWYFDPENNPSTFISENIYEYFTLRVQKSGYKEYNTRLDISAKIKQIITLKKLYIEDFNINKS